MNKKLTNFGIYAIVNKINNKKYVGSAINFKTRWGQHRSELNKNKHDNSYLQNSWNKYGEYTFEFWVLETVENKKNLIDREQIWIDYYKSNKRENGYNLRIKAESNVGIKLTEEIKKKITLAHKGKIFSKKTKQKISIATSGKNNPMYGRKGKDAPSFGKPGTMLGKKHSEETKKKMSKTRKGKKHNKPRTEEFKLRMLMNQPNRKEVFQIEKDNFKIIKLWPSARSVYRKLKIKHSDILRCCLYYNTGNKTYGKRILSAGGFKWVKLEDLPNNNELIRKLFFKEENTSG